MSQQLNSKYYEKDDVILVQTLGTVAKDVAANSWILNLPQVIRQRNLN